MKDLNKLKEQYSKLGEEIKRLENKTDLYPNEDNTGYYIGSMGTIMLEENLNGAGVSFNVNNWFPTEEEAEKELEKRRAIARVKKYIIDNGMYFEPGWDDINQEKFNIYYYDKDTIDYECSLTICNYSPIGYLKSEEDCKKIKEDCMDDLLIIYKP